MGEWATTAAIRWHHSTHHPLGSTGNLCVGPKQTYMPEQKDCMFMCCVDAP